MMHFENHATLKPVRLLNCSRAPMTDRVHFAMFPARYFGTSCGACMIFALNGHLTLGPIHWKIHIANSFHTRCEDWNVWNDGLDPTWSVPEGISIIFVTIYWTLCNMIPIRRRPLQFTIRACTPRLYFYPIFPHLQTNVIPNKREVLNNKSLCPCNIA